MAGVASVGPAPDVASGLPDPPPTVGRVVHLYPAASPGPWAAIVTAPADGGAHLEVFPPPGWGKPPYGTVWPFSPEPTPGHWTWPPET